jgi:drug/metabolite transporter (DMT)-like permease
MIELSPALTIWIRCLFGGIALLVFILLAKIPLRIRPKHFKTIFYSSVFLGVHWITYFISLQLSNVAIAMLSLFTYPVFTAFLEPLVLRTRFLWSNLILGLLVVIGVFFMIPEFDLENNYTIGVILGLVSAILYSLRNLILKKHIAQYPGTTLMFYQLVINAVILLPVLFIYQTDGFSDNLTPLILLAVLTTAIGHTMFVQSFKRFSISAVSIMSSLQPLLGIVVAYFVLHEVPAITTFIGGGLILITVVIESMRTVKNS